jgi:hypothetical protein
VAKSVVTAALALLVLAALSASTPSTAKMVTLRQCNANLANCETQCKKKVGTFAIHKCFRGCNNTYEKCRANSDTTIH